MIYVAHGIRGSEPHSAGKQQANLERAREAAKLIRQKYPDLEFYVPAEHDDFPQECLRRGLLSVNDILSVDLSILKRCNELWVLLPENDCGLSAGVVGEIAYAASQGIPVWFTTMEELQ